MIREDYVRMIAHANESAKRCEAKGFPDTAKLYRELVVKFQGLMSA